VSACSGVYPGTLRPNTDPASAGFLFFLREQRRVESGEVASMERLDLRSAYGVALAKFASATAVLTRHRNNGTHPTQAEIQSAEDARVILEGARKAYLSAWQP
jgi:hypothetical protein